MLFQEYLTRGSGRVVILFVEESTHHREWWAGFQGFACSFSALFILLFGYVWFWPWVVFLMGGRDGLSIVHVTCMAGCCRFF